VNSETREVLTDSQWLRLEDLLPGRVGHVGCTAKDNRLFLEAVLWIARTGSPWRDLPDKFGFWANVYVRYNRWCKEEKWQKVFETLSQDPDFEYVMIDSTIVRTHQHAAGGKGGLKIRILGDHVVVIQPKSMLS
jgi:putative transposase